MATSVVAAAVAAVRVAGRRSPGPDFPAFQKVGFRPVAVELAPLPVHFLLRLLRHRRQKGSRPGESVRQSRSSQAIETGLDTLIARKASVKPKCSAVAMQPDFQRALMRLRCSVPGQAGNRCLNAMQPVSKHFLSRARQDFSSVEMRSYPPFPPTLYAFRNIPTITEKLHHRRVEQSVTVPPFRGGFYLIGLLRTPALQAQEFS